MYWEITAVNKMFSSKVNTWPNLNEGERLRVLRNVVDAVVGVYDKEDGRRDKGERESEIRSAINSVIQLEARQGIARKNNA